MGVRCSRVSRIDVTQPKSPSSAPLTEPVSPEITDVPILPPLSFESNPDINGNSSSQREPPENSVRSILGSLLHGTPRQPQTVRSSKSATNPEAPPEPKNATESKLQQALQKKRKEQQAKGKSSVSFEKILLRFEKLRVVLGYVRQAFNSVAVNGRLGRGQMETALKRLEVAFTAEEMNELCDIITVQDAESITMKEFLVALTIGMVLDAIPLLAEPTSIAGMVEEGVVEETSPKSQSGTTNVEKVKRSFSGLMGHHSEIRAMLNVIVSAYLIFDPEGRGFIERANVERMIEESGGTRKNVMLSSHRWAEMDWDSNGTIDFAEFVFSFTSWVDLDNID